MERPENDNWLDEALSETIGSEKPRTDFEQWKKNHPQAVEMLTLRAGRVTSIYKSPLNIRNLIMRMKRGFGMYENKDMNKLIEKLYEDGKSEEYHILTISASIPYFIDDRFVEVEITLKHPTDMTNDEILETAERIKEYKERFSKKEE